MPALLHRYATPFITGLFLISLISGLALFVGVGRGTFREMHEVLSVALVIPFALHLWRNWRSMTGYLRHAPMALALAVSGLLALGFALTSGGGGGEGAGGPPQFALADAMLDDVPATLAPVLGLAPEALVARLQAAGLTVPAPEATLSEIAAASGRSSQEALAALLPTGS